MHEYCQKELGYATFLPQEYYSETVNDRDARLAVQRLRNRTIQPAWAPAVDVSSSEDPGRFNTDLAERRESAVEPDAPLAGIHGDDSYQFLLPIRQNSTFNTLVPATPG